MTGFIARLTILLFCDIGQLEPIQVGSTRVRVLDPYYVDGGLTVRHENRGHQVHRGMEIFKLAANAVRCLGGLHLRKVARDDEKADFGP